MRMLCLILHSSTTFNADLGEQKPTYGTDDANWILKDPFPFFGESERISSAEITKLRSQVAEIIAWWIFSSGPKTPIPGVAHGTTRFSNESLHLVLRYMHTEVDDALVMHMADLLLQKMVHFNEIERKVFLDALHKNGGYFLWFSLTQRASDSTRTVGIALLHSHAYYRKILIGNRFSSWLAWQLERYPLSLENYTALMKMMLGIKPDQRNIAFNAVVQEPAMANVSRLSVVYRISFVFALMNHSLSLSLSLSVCVCVSLSLSLVYSGTHQLDSWKDIPIRAVGCFD